MDLKLNIEKKGLGLTPTEGVSTEEHILYFGHIFRGKDAQSITIDTELSETSNNAIANSAVTKAVQAKQDKLSLTTKANGNIVIGNLAGQTKEFMPATPSGDPMHYQYLAAFPINANSGRGLKYDANSDRWSYMEESGGIADLTTAEVKTIFAWSGSGAADGDNISGKYYGSQMRTNFCAMNGVDRGWGYVNPTAHYAFLQSTVEVAVLGPYNTTTYTPNACNGMFYECRSLRRVIGRLSLQYAAITDIFRQCSALEHINITMLNKNISFADSPLLSKESLLYMIDNCASGVSFTIVVHPDVHDKCQEFGEWYEDINNAIIAALEDKETSIGIGKP